MFEGDLGPMVGWFSSRIFLGRAQRRLIRRGVPVLAYHKIATPPAGTRDPFLYDEPLRFDSQLAALRRARCQSTGLDEVVTADGNERMGAVITFDDGCLNVLEQGLQILARHQFRAIQFLVPRFLGQRNEWDISKGDVPERLMDEGQVREWLDAGHDIGSHSLTHRNLRRLSLKEAREEILGSKQWLEDRFGRAIRHFSYPFGAWNEAVCDLVREAGYTTGCSMDFGVNDRTTDPYALRRVFPLTTGEMLRKIAHRLKRRSRFSRRTPV